MLKRALKAETVMLLTLMKSTPTKVNADKPTAAKKIQIGNRLRSGYVLRIAARSGGGLYFPNEPQLLP